MTTNNFSVSSSNSVYAAIVILNYNDYITTENLISQISDYRSIDLIVVVDNKSTDGSFDILKKLSSDKIHVIQTDHNGGYGYGNNYGVVYAERLGAKYVAISNPDVEFSEKCFISLVNALEEDQKCSCVAPLSYTPNGSLSPAIAWKQPGAFIETMTMSVIMIRLLRKLTHYKLSSFSNSNDVVVDIVPGSFLMVNTKLFIEAGMYDEGVFLYCEEKILAARFRKINAITKLLLTESYIHHHSVTINKNIKSHFNKTMTWMRSKEYFIRNYLYKDKYAFVCNVFVKLVYSFAKIEQYSIRFAKSIVRKQ